MASSPVRLPIDIDMRVAINGGRKGNRLCPDELHCAIGGRPPDTEPSLAVYPDHAHCFGCGWHGGIIRWVMDVARVPYREALEIIRSGRIPQGTTAGRRLPQAGKANPPAIPTELTGMSLQDIVYAGQRGISARRDKRAYLHSRCLTDDTIDAFWIGWHDGWYIIPVRNEVGTTVSIKCRRDPMYNGGPRYWQIGEATVFNPSAIIQARMSRRPLLICEGEFDTILATQVGFLAATYTGGQGSLVNLASQIENTCALLCLDADEVVRNGRYLTKAQEPIARAFGNRIIRWPDGWGGTGRKDITDFVARYGESALLAIVDSSLAALTDSQEIW